MDEEVLPDRDPRLNSALREVRGKRTTYLVPRAGVVLEALSPEEYDILDLRREFHGGGELDDLRAGEALLDAVRVLSENFERTDEDGADLR